MAYPVEFLAFGILKQERMIMLAIIETGGKQYKVKEGDILPVEILDIEKDKSVTFDKVLLVVDKEVSIGKPS